MNWPFIKKIDDSITSEMIIHGSVNHNLNQNKLALIKKAPNEVLKNLSRQILTEFLSQSVKDEIEERSEKTKDYKSIFIGLFVLVLGYFLLGK